MKLPSAFLILMVCGAGVPCANAQQSCYGQADLNADGVVDLDDYTLIGECISGPGAGVPPCGPNQFLSADLDDDADVDLADVARFMENFQNQYFVYGPHRDNLEAEMLAMALSGQLRAPDSVYDRILRDLQLIRTRYPELVTVIDDPDYAPDQLIVNLNSAMPDDNYVAQNEFYLLQIEEVFSWGRVLTFCDNLNAPVLAAIYAALPEVNWAEPNGFIGHDDQITATDERPLYRYDIDDGFHDCFDGCDCHRVWVFTVDAGGSVTLVSYNEWGQPWCEF